MRIAVLTAAALASASVLSPASAAGTGYFFRSKPMVASSTSIAPLTATAATSVSLVPGGTAKPFSATGGTQPYAWSATGLPAGVTLAADGTLAVTANAVTGTTAGLTATITDAAGKTATATFALTVTAPMGSLMAFGSNGFGQVLPNSTADQASPVAVGSATDWSMVAATPSSSCGIRNGDLYCWGYNSGGELGTNGTANVADGPRLVSAGGWSDVQAGPSGHTCGIRFGGAYCWGSNAFGQIGDGTKTARKSGPVVVDGGSNGWTDITVGGEHSCGIRSGVAYCWGSDFSGQVGIGSTAVSRSVSAVGGGSGTSGWTEISAGAESTCGIRKGELLCWGRNVHGGLGSNGTGSLSVPTPVSGTATGWSGLSSGLYHTCAVRSGTAYCWGYNQSGQVGANGTENATSGPLAVGGGSGTTGWSMLAAGGYHTCGIRSGTLFCWGTSGGDGRLGVPGASEGPTLQIVAGSGWKYVSAGQSHTLALK